MLENDFERADWGLPLQPQNFHDRRDRPIRKLLDNQPPRAYAGAVRQHFTRSKSRRTSCFAADKDVPILQPPA